MKKFLFFYLLGLAIIVLILPKIKMDTHIYGVDRLLLTVILIAIGFFIDFVINKSDYSLEKIKMKAPYFVVLLVILLYQFRNVIF